MRAQRNTGRAGRTAPCYRAGEVLHPAETVLAEAKLAPAVGERCALSGGRWFSEYDQVWVTAASSLDVDHMVPLAEAWIPGHRRGRLPGVRCMRMTRGPGVADRGLGQLQSLQERQGPRRLAARRGLPV